MSIREALIDYSKGDNLRLYAERVRYNKAFYSLDCDDGLEYSACLHEPTPQELMDRVDLFVRL